MSDLHAALDELVDVVVERLAAKLGTAPPSRVALDKVTEHGAPSARWVRARARAGAIEIMGPKGSQFVERAALEELLRGTSIRKRRHGEPAASTVDVVADLAARRAKRDQQKGQA